MGKLNGVIMFGDKRNEHDYDNGVYMAMLDLPFVQIEDDLKPYDWIINTLWMEATISGRNKRIKTRWPAKKLIGLSDHPLSTHISRMPPQHQIDYIADLEYCNAILALTEEERQWYQIAVPSKPVIKMGLPFPFESYTKKYGQFVNSEKKWIGLGVGAADNDRNFITSYTIYQRLKLDFPEIQGVFMSIPSNLLKNVVPLCDAGTDLYIHERDGMGSFYDVLSQCKFVINMADRNTPGRLQGEAAFFGVPVIGSNRLELQNELFPNLAVSPFSAEDAYLKAVELMNTDPIEIVEKAKKKLHAYDYAHSKKKFNALLKMLDE